MGIQRAIVRSPRCSLVNITTGESIDCLFNPAQLVEKVQVNWTRLNVPGLSHQVLQYQSTTNRKLDGVEFYLDRFFASAQPGSPDILTFRSFLRGLTVPPSEALAPPRTLVIWPKVLTVETVLTKLEFEYRQFATDASVLVYVAKCAFESILDLRVTSEELRRES
ncbi:MAG: peptidoglycan-binding protein [Deltaproteobacteria bacterium]|nr:peptidoglycan-binding protein [Deltaproteobacteria bacterium]